MSLSNDELEVLRNIISGAETGGQVYGGGRYDDFTPAYANSDKEHAITIGRYQHYGNEALQLLRKIRTADPELFKKLDTAGISKDMYGSWSNYKLTKGSAKAKCIQKIISSDIGIKCQDDMMNQQMRKYANIIEKKGITDHQAICMAINWYHQAQSSVDRILKKAKKPYNLDNLYEACKSDVGNQVGAYRSRQKFVYTCLKKYFPSNTNSNESNNDASLILRFGSKGTDVKEMQSNLIKAGFSCGSAGADGDFGKSTESAVKLFQTIYGLTANGIFDTTTQKALKKILDSGILFSKSLHNKWYKVAGAKFLHFRKDAGTSKEIICSMQHGARVLCSGCYKVVEGTKWYHIAYNKKTGYASSKYLTRA